MVVTTCCNTPSGRNLGCTRPQAVCKDYLREVVGAEWDLVVSISQIDLYCSRATAPFLRICGDYTGVSKFIEHGHFPIPVVKHELGKIIEFQLYMQQVVATIFWSSLLSSSTICSYWSEVHILS
jgi:hypothetical protein